MNSTAPLQTDVPGVLIRTSADLRLMAAREAMGMEMDMEVAQTLDATQSTMKANVLRMESVSGAPARMLAVHHFPSARETQETLQDQTCVSL